MKQLLTVIGILLISLSARAQEQPAQHDSIRPPTRSERRAQVRKARLDTILRRKNVIALDALELANGGIGLCYTREFFHGRMGLNVPVSIGFAKPLFNNLTVNTKDDNYYSSFTYDRKAFEIGLTVNCHTSDRPVTHFIGVLASMAQYVGRFEEYSVNFNSQGKHNFTLNYYYLMLNNGVLFRINKHLNFSLNLAIGHFDAQYKGDAPHLYNYHISAYNNIKAGFFLGYRF